MHDLIIFDDGLGQLGPMADLRAAFEIRTGMFTTAGRIAQTYQRARFCGFRVPAHLEALVRSRANALVNDLPDIEPLLLINGRWSMPDPDLNL
ncbi:MAG: putative sugar nucleotidyl transferase, partial [Planctomycetota bacterium]